MGEGRGEREGNKRQKGKKTGEGIAREGEKIVARKGEGKSKKSQVWERCKR